MKRTLVFGALISVLSAASASNATPAPPPALRVENLPPVIIGDEGDVVGSGAGALHLLRYENVINLLSSVYAPALSQANLKFYYTVPDPTSNTMRASNKTKKVEPLTAAEIAGLTLGTPPPTAKQLNSATSFWLSLIHDAGTTAVTSAKSATPQKNGATIQALTAKHSLEATVFTLYATDTADLGADGKSSGSFAVYSIIGAEDNFSPTSLYPPHLYKSRFGANETDGWRSWDQFPQPQILRSYLPTTVTANGFGFTGLASFGPGQTQAYSYWTNVSSPYLPTFNMGGKVFRAALKLTGNAATPLQTPGYRFLFTSVSFAHLGGFQVTTKGSAAGDTGSAINYPSNGVAVCPRVYWAVPAGTNQYADGEKVSTFVVGQDMRQYFFYFEAMQTEAGDVGTLVLESVVVDKIERSPGVVTYVKWGGSDGYAFNAPGRTWKVPVGDAGTGWDTGVGSVTPFSVMMSMAPGKSSVFQQANPQLSPAVGYPVWTSDKLLRFSYNLSASDTSACPQIRMFVLGWTLPVSQMKLGNMSWGEALDPTVFRANNAWPAKTGPYSFGLGGSPKIAGSDIETYVYTGNAPTLPAEQCILAPILDIDQAPGATFPVRGYPKPDATIAVNRMLIEEVD